MPDRDFLVKLHDDLAELSELPPFTKDAERYDVCRKVMQSKIRLALINQIMENAILNSLQMTECMFAIGSRIDKDGAETWAPIAEICAEEIAKREPRREQIEAEMREDRI